MHNLHANLDSCAADNVKVWSCVICRQADETLGYLQIQTCLSLSMCLVHMLCLFVCGCMCVRVCVGGGGVLNALERFFELMERYGSQISCKSSEAYRRNRQSDVSLMAPRSACKLSECDFDNANVNIR